MLIQLCPAPTLPATSSRRKRPGLSTQDPGKAFCPWGVTCPGVRLPDLTPQENGYRPGEGAYHATPRETPAQGGEARLCLALLQASHPGQALTQGPASATQPQSMAWAGAPGARAVTDNFPRSQHGYRSFSQCVETKWEETIIICR